MIQQLRTALDAVNLHISTQVSPSVQSYGLNINSISLLFYIYLHTLIPSLENINHLRSVSVHLLFQDKVFKSLIVLFTQE